MASRLLTLLFATAFLAACQAATPPPAEAEPPPAAMAPADRAADQAFQRFARSWMGKLRAGEKQTRGKPQVSANGVTYRAVGTEFKTELRPTGHPSAPYVGLLRYNERLFQCTDASLKSCTVTAVTPVTEIFRYQGGRWVY